jgi:hypothetical protein
MLYRKLARMLLVSPLASALIQLSGCATILSGTTDTLTFDANVPNVRLTVEGEDKGVLPQTVTVSRHFINGRSFLVKFEAPGYETQEFQLKREFNWVAVLDITSVLTSGGIDLMTGALMKFTPTDYHVQMVKRGKNPRSSDLERSRRLWLYALTNYGGVQMDLIHGGGEYLDSLASALGGSRPGADVAIREHALRHAPTLLEASGAHDFVHRLNDVLAVDPGLRAYQI